ncbi:MAG: AI-2E family transporter [Rhodothermales bacterium]
MPPEKAEINRPSLPETRLTALQTTLLAGGVVLFIALLYEMRDFVSPPVIGVAGSVLLWPLRKLAPVRGLLIAGGVMLLIWALAELAGILLPFVVVYLFAYLFDPLASRARERYGIARGVTSIAVTALLVGIFAAFIFLLVPSLISQFEVLVRRLVDGMGGFRQWLQSAALLDNIESVGLDRQQVVNDLTRYLQERATGLAASIPNFLQHIMSSLGTVLGTVAIVAVLPVVHYYVLKDYPHIKRRLVELFPTFGGRRDYLFEASGIVGNYLRGQLLISAIAGFNVSVLLILLDVPFALLIGIIGGLLNLIPNVGIIITNVIGIFIALVFGDPWYLDLIKIVSVLLGQSLLEQAVLTPNIMSHKVGLHPALIIISLFVFGHFMGAIGLLIAVPVTALIMTVYKTYRDSIAFELSDDDA